VEVQPVNHHDTALFDESFAHLLELTDDLSINLEESYVTMDSGFCSFENRATVQQAGMIPVIKPNLRGLKNQEKINQVLDEFEGRKHIYEKRYAIERCFAWEDSYLKLVIRYEKLQSTFMGFRYLAYSMINFRSIFKNNCGET